MSTGVGDRCLSFHFTPEFLEGVWHPCRAHGNCVYRSAPASAAIADPGPLLRPKRRGCRRWRRAGGAGLQLAGAVSAALIDAKVEAARLSRRDDAVRSRAAAHRDGRARAALARRPRVRGGDQPVSFSAHLPRRRGNNAASVRAANPAAPGRRAAAPIERGRLLHRARQRVQ